jgi:hypothetical protein
LASGSSGSDLNPLLLLRKPFASMALAELDAAEIELLRLLAEQCRYRRALDDRAAVP